MRFRLTSGIRYEAPAMSRALHLMAIVLEHRRAQVREVVAILLIGEVVDMVSRLLDAALTPKFLSTFENDVLLFR